MPTTIPDAVRAQCSSDLPKANRLYRYSWKRGIGLLGLVVTMAGERKTFRVMTT